MMEYEFTLRFDLSGVSETLEECVELLYENGCDDALVGIGTPGHIGLMFGRNAPTAEQAVTSAVRDVRRALPEAVLI
jgi:hypothetical protein